MSPFAGLDIISLPLPSILPSYVLLHPEGLLCSAIGLPSSSVSQSPNTHSASIPTNLDTDIFSNVSALSTCRFGEQGELETKSSEDS